MIRTAGQGLALLFCLCAGFLVRAQNPFKENTTWHTSQRIDGPFEEIILRQIDPDNYSRQAYYRISLQPGGQFLAYNIPGCGLDCVVHTTGTYTTTDSTIRFILGKTTRHKGCHGDTMLNRDIGTYYWIQDDYNLRLVSNFDDEPKADYFAQLPPELPMFKDDSLKLLLKQCAYVYNRLYQVVRNKNSRKYRQFLNDTEQWRLDALSYKGGKSSEELLRFRAQVVTWSDRLRKMLKEIEPVSR